MQALHRLRSHTPRRHEDSNRDHVRGIVHAKSLLRLIVAEGPQADIEGLVRAAPHTELARGGRR